MPLEIWVAGGCAIPDAFPGAVRTADRPAFRRMVRRPAVGLARWPGAGARQGRRRARPAMRRAVRPRHGKKRGDGKDEVAKRDGTCTDMPGRTCDYLLVAGPGRSGSTYLYRLLNAHGDFVAPQAKEGHYYRSARRFERARRRLGGGRAVLLDAANTAWCDPRLDGVAALRGRGHRVVVVVLLRDHLERAVSVMGWRHGRALVPRARALERAAVEESLTGEALGRIFALGVDVLTVRFETLVGDPDAVLAAIAGLCGTGGFARAPRAPVNASVRARAPLLGAAARLGAVALRAAGARALVQSLKDEPRIARLFFRPERAGERFVPGAAAAAELARRRETCLAALDAACPLGEGLWLVRGGAPCGGERRAAGPATQRARGGAWRRSAAGLTQGRGDEAMRQPVRRGRYKRAFDLGVVAAAGLALAPLWAALFAVTALAIRLDSPGPVLYRQIRLGRGGRAFALVKFRTMVEGAEARTGPVWAGERDPRTTRVGRVLRRWHVDELPQVVNVLRGEMSLVGPRPERPALAARIEREVPGFSRRLRVRPGIMGLAQALGPYHWDPRLKLRCDERYIAAMSPWLDVRLALACMARVVRNGVRVRRTGEAPAAPGTPRRRERRA